MHEATPAPSAPLGLPMVYLVDDEDVLRDAMASDALAPAGVYVGTNTGQLFHSADEGDTWQQARTLFPPIQSVGTATI